MGFGMSSVELRGQLEGISTDDSGGFQLSELDNVLRRDEQLQEEGIEYAPALAPARPDVNHLLAFLAHT